MVLLARMVHPPHLQSVLRPFRFPFHIPAVASFYKAQWTTVRFVFHFFERHWTSEQITIRVITQSRVFLSKEIIFSLHHIGVGLMMIIYKIAWLFAYVMLVAWRRVTISCFFRKQRRIEEIRLWIRKLRVISMMLLPADVIMVFMWGPVVAVWAWRSFAAALVRSPVAVTTRRGLWMRVWGAFSFVTGVTGIFFCVLVSVMGLLQDRFQHFRIVQLIQQFQMLWVL